MKVITVVTHST